VVYDHSDRRIDAFADPIRALARVIFPEVMLRSRSSQN